jgi:hypothetical protein
MAKETTSTFTITVTHAGPKKSFSTLFRQKATVKKCATKLDKTNTVKIAPISKYTDEQKMGRLLLKNALEAAGLKYTTDPVIVGKYYVDYAWPCYKDGYTSYEVRVGHARIGISFEKGLSSTGRCQIYSYSNKIYSDKTQHYKWRKPQPNDEFDINLADPSINKLLESTFVKWGLGTAPSK